MVIKELARAEDLGNKGNRWYPGWKLRELDYLESSNKSYRLWHQPSNFKLIFTRTNQTLWTSNTFANEIDVLFLEKRGQYLELQNDGNLVMYTESGKPVWSIGTDTQASNMLVHLNLDVPYEQSLARSGYLLSATGKFKLLLNDDGFLTLSDAKSGVRIWEPHTNGKAARELRMQADGNLVLYGGFEMDPVWASDTHNCGRGCRAVLEDWGDLVVYDKEGDKRLWSSDASVTELQINYARISGPFG